MTGWRICSCRIAAGVATGLLLGACGSGKEQSANQAHGSLVMQVTAATFPALQHLAERTQLVLAVRNTGTRTLPDVAVTITDPPHATYVQGFQHYLNMPGLASHSRPVWIIDEAPGPCGYSCQTGGPGAAATAYSNTWALGALQPKRNAKATGTDGRPPWGTFIVKIDSTPRYGPKPTSESPAGS